jgi:REP element-mobilizing transposase RayT
MTHAPRVKGETGFYHVVAKGDGGQILFESDESRIRFINMLKAAAADHKMRIHAYCLMDNHIHLLVEDRDDNLSAFMKQVNEKYAAHYRKVTRRVGHVFQGRFWSEPLDGNERFLATLRYIHANPEPARICRAKDYRWSSYKAYTEGTEFVSTELALGLLGSRESFEDFHLNGGSFAKPFPKSTLARHLSYDELLHIAESIIGHDTLIELKQQKPEDRLRYFLELSNAGFTDTQISRLTGIGQASISRSLKKS